MQHHQLLCARPDLCFCVLAVMRKGRREWVAVEGFESGVYSSGREKGASVLQHPIFRQGQFGQERRQQFTLLVGTGSLQVTRKEVEWRRDGQVEPKAVENLLLHVQDLLTVVRLVGDVHKVADLGRPNLFIFCCKKHGGHTNKLQVLSAHGILGQETIDQVGGQEQRLGHKLELEMPPHEPVNKDCAHLVVDIRLVAHVVHRYSCVGLDATPIAVDIVHIFSASQRILTISRVNVRHLFLRLAGRSGTLAAREQKARDALVVGTIQSQVGTDGKGAAVVAGLERGRAAASSSPSSRVFSNI
mmetsp:Transcript_35877/g.60452  ORF Transcript_35877/g.60452 Transcript_35877/m.60452 type:complete len:301 (-) Transcript_35877:261-1163(-)